jgi:hypothetical protein
MFFLAGVVMYFFNLVILLYVENTRPSYVLRSSHVVCASIVRLVSIILSVVRRIVICTVNSSSRRALTVRY